MESSHHERSWGQLLFTWHLWVFRVVLPGHSSPTMVCMLSQVLHGRQLPPVSEPGDVPSGLHRAGSMYWPTLHRGQGRHLGGFPGGLYLM
jgi:hypothetical protein